MPLVERLKRLNWLMRDEINMVVLPRSTLTLRHVQFAPSHHRRMRHFPRVFGRHHPPRHERRRQLLAGGVFVVDRAVHARR